MRTEVQTQGAVKVIVLHDKILLSSNISEVEQYVKQLLDEGWRNIALTYPPGSFFNSYSIAVLVRSHETIVDYDGTFIIVRPTAEIINFLEMFHIDDTIQTCESLESLQSLKLKKNLAV
jgi:hypothetical protein